MSFTKRLLNIADVVQKTETSDPSSRPDEVFSYVDIASVSNSTFKVVNPRLLTGREAPSRARKKIKGNDVIIATTRPYLKSIAQVPASLENQICSTGFCVLRHGDQVLSDWLFYFAISNNFMKQIRPLMRGANYPAVTDKDILGAKIPVPPLPEQRRIIARIKQCMERIEEMEQLWACTQKERGALLESVIESKILEAEGDFVALADVCAITSSLVNPTQPPFLEAKHVGGANIESSTGQLLDLKTSSEEKLKSSKFPFDRGMVLYNKIRPYLKKVARPDFEGICSADMYPLAPNTQRLSRDYLFFVLLSRNFTRYAIEGSNRAGMPKVNRDHLFRYRFKLPNLSQQMAVCERLNEALETLLSLRAESETKQQSQAHLRDAILRKAFAGEL